MVTQYNAEAFFSIDAHSEAEAERVLYQAMDACDKALKALNLTLPHGTRVDLNLEDTQGKVEVA